MRGNVMSCIGGFADDDYYRGLRAGLDDTTYTIGAVVIPRPNSTGASQGIFSAVNAENTGWGIRMLGGDWSQTRGQYFMGQAGVTKLVQPSTPIPPSSSLQRAVFVCVAADAVSNVQQLYINGTLVDSAAADLVAAASSFVAVGRSTIPGLPCDAALINTVFYTNDLLTHAEIQATYSWLSSYGRLPPSGIIAAGWQIDHFWDLIDNKSVVADPWVSRGAVGEHELELINQTPPSALTITYLNEVHWGW
jgi:hypothetical protein